MPDAFETLDCAAEVIVGDPVFRFFVSSKPLADQI
jgi:hypothetical protein